MARKTTAQASETIVKRKPGGLPPGTVAFTPIEPGRKCSVCDEGLLPSTICSVIGRDGMARRVDEWELHWWELSRRYIEGKRGEPDFGRIAHFEVGYHQRKKFRGDPLETDPQKVYQQVKAYMGSNNTPGPLNEAMLQLLGGLTKAWKKRNEERRTMRDFAPEPPTHEREPGEEG